MRNLIILALLSLLVIGRPIHAQDTPQTEGLVLIRAADPGGREPHRLFIADVGPEGGISELLVQNESFFAPWFGWSPDGARFAYLAPARRGTHFELWLGNANRDLPSPRAPFFTINRELVAADWNPVFNMIATASLSDRDRDGVYILYSQPETINYLVEESFSRATWLDWAGDGRRLIYRTAEGDLVHLNTDEVLRYPVHQSEAFIPARLPFAGTGWTADNRAYVFVDDALTSVYAVLTDGAGPAVALPPPFEDPYNVRLLPDDPRLAALEGNQIRLLDVTTGETLARPVPGVDRLAPGFAAGRDGVLVLNTFLSLPDGDYAECALLDVLSGEVRFARAELGAADWTHTQCILLPGGAHIALRATSDPRPLAALPDDLPQQLFILPLSLQGGGFIRPDYPGFTLAPLGFDPVREQVIYRDDDALVVVGLNGARRVLAPLDELDVDPAFVTFSYLWQP